jgi:hypothetical protein
MIDATMEGILKKFLNWGLNYSLMLSNRSLLFLGREELDARVRFVSVDIYIAKMILDIIYVLRDSSRIIGFGQVMVKQFPRIKVLQAVVADQWC